MVGAVSGLPNPNDSSVGAVEGRPAVTQNTMRTAAVAADIPLFEDWADAIEEMVRGQVRGFIEAMLEEELEDVLARPRYGRRKPSDDGQRASIVGCRHGHRKRTVTRTFGKSEISVPRARLMDEVGKTHE